MKKQQRQRMLKLRSLAWMLVYGYTARFVALFIPWLTQALQVSLLVAKGYVLFLGQATQQQCTMRLLTLVHAMPCNHEPESQRSYL